MISVVWAENGSSTAVDGSGIRIMSNSLIAFQPAIEEPSNMTPSSKVPSSVADAMRAVCCHLPRGSVKRKSTNLTSFSLIIARTCLASIVGRPSTCGLLLQPPKAGSSDGGVTTLTSTNSDRVVDARHENLAVADATGMRRLRIASTAFSTISSSMTSSSFTFGRKSTTYSAPRYSSVWPFCRPKPLASRTVMPLRPISIAGRPSPHRA